ncbi:MAG: alpha/beta hydrolase [Paracoccaceae bacterium]|nr:alpha/beta hydrolase [Paracoccaceae bacterium]
MSLMRRPLNLYLRLTERPHLSRVSDPEKLRRSFEIKARFFFHPPRGTRLIRREIAGVPALEVQGHDTGTTPLILYFHGGGYVFGSARTHSAMLARLSALSGAPAVLPDYRMAPEHVFPAALDDALAVYAALADQGRPIVLGGDSAGGGLALALLARILEEGLPPPLGCFAFSPWTDLTLSGESLTTNAATEVILPPERIAEGAQHYLGDAPADAPGASPLFADFDGALPVWLSAGTTEILLDDTRRMTQRLRDQGVTVTEVIETDLPHVWPLFQTLLPEARATLREVAGWINSLSRSSAGN